MPCFRRLSRQFRRGLTTASISSPSNNLQIYTSKSNCPITNLSLEHHLLTRTPASSTILLLYVNSPSVIFGRNQNPWLETNLAALKGSSASAGGDGLSDIQLVRRRSGGGTVFHDEGNVNFSVICPPEAFDRDKHAEMVVRALGKLGKQARVNERHDIVVDRPHGTFKISGSAYKLTRLRSLHHGTCLLSSPNLKLISPLLASPAEPFLKARGVDSVRSPVANVDVGVDEFKDAVVGEFRAMYGDADVREEVGEEVTELHEVGKGMEELKTREWVFGQTPRFTFSTARSEEDDRERPALPFKVSKPCATCESTS